MSFGIDVGSEVNILIVLNNINIIMNNLYIVYIMLEKISENYKISCNLIFRKF